MTFRQVIQAGPAKANELFAKLAETTDGAVKTREKLFADLKAELELHADLEEQHLLPILRKHAETKDLVPAARRDNKEVRARLAELDQAPKDGAAFLERLGELKALFQRQVRDERKELLPAVQTALSADEAEAAAAAIEAGKAEAERAKREEADRRRAEARQEREQAERRAAEEQAAEQARKAAERRAREAARAAAEAAEQAVKEAGDRARSVAGAVADTAERAAATVLVDLDGYRKSAEATVEDLRAVAVLPNVAASGLAEIRSAWLAWLGRSVSEGAETSRRMLQARTVHQLADAQRAFLAGAMRNWMESNVRVLEISRRMTDDALRPLQGRIAAGDDQRTPDADRTRAAAR